MTYRAIVYIDGFNLYYGLVRDTPYKWLNLDSLCRALLRPKDNLLAIKYYTALVKSPGNDPTQQQRQLTFLRALQTIPHLTVFKGQFLSHPTRMPLASPPPNGPKTVEVIKTEEKGTDVNLACHLLVDAFQNRFDLALVLSGDSDLAEPIRLARTLFPAKIVGVWNPRKKPSIELKKCASFYKHIDHSLLPKCQFPIRIIDRSGRTIIKPREW